MYPALYLFTDMARLQALAFISKAEKNIVVIVPLDERVVYKIVVLSIGSDAILRAEFKHPIQHRFVDADLYIRLQRFQDRLKIQNRLFKVAGTIGFLQRVLLLPGGNTWDDPKHGAAVKKAAELLSAGGTVCAICGATAALARAGLLDRRPHTSNGAGFLEMFCPNYKGTSFYVDMPSVSDGNLITASGAGALPWAKQILAHLDVFRSDTLEAWYAYFRTVEAQHFFALMQTLPSDN